MHSCIRAALFLGLLVFLTQGAVVRASSADDQSSVVITFKGGQQQSFPAADVAQLELKSPATIVFKDGHRRTLDQAIVRIDFKSAATLTLGQNHFLGKWRCGDGMGGTFFITLKRDGAARKSTGSQGGTWKVVDGEAHISWDDGWHDIIRKVGNKHEKVAFAPGKSFSDQPSNIAVARNENTEPI